MNLFYTQRKSSPESFPVREDRKEPCGWFYESCFESRSRLPGYSACSPQFSPIPERRGGCRACSKTFGQGSTIAKGACCRCTQLSCSRLRNPPRAVSICCLATDCSRF